MGATAETSSMCDGLQGKYSFPFHISAIFIVLFASALGTVLPILTKYVEVLRENPFYFTVGKTAATGVLLSVSTIHLIHESEEAFNEHCIAQFFQSYSAYHFLFALVAALAMHALDLQLAAVAERWLKAKQSPTVEAVDDTTPIDPCSPQGNQHGQQKPDSVNGQACGFSNCNSNDVGDTSSSKNNRHAATPPAAGAVNATESQCAPPHQLMQASAQQQHRRDADDEEAHYHYHHHHQDSDSHGHQHLVFEIPEDFGLIRKIISAVCMEFGVTLHSVFVGLAVGLTTDTELKPLLFALFFHQLFEGMALGSRLVDAKFSSKLEGWMAVTFCLSAPAGMTLATATLSVSMSALSGTFFVSMIAVLNALCGGILLYLAFSLLLFDFADDMRKFGADGCVNAGTCKVVLYLALWLGMLLMAFVGKWL